MTGRIAVATIILMALNGCGGGSSSKSQTTTTTIPDPVIELPTIDETQLLNDIQTLLDTAPCASSSGQTCSMVDVSFEPAKDWSNENRPRRRILLIDSGFATAALTGYRNRVLDIYTVDDAMALAPHRPRLSIPESLHKVYGAINDYDEFISVEKFKQFQNDTNFKLLQKIDLVPGHGYFIGSFLMEHNPQAQMVILEQGKESWLYAPKEQCLNMLSDDTNLQKQALATIKQRFIDYEASIKTIVDTHKIDYINASWGASRRTISQIISRTCGNAAQDNFVSNVLSIDHQFMTKIGHLNYQDGAQQRPVILVQAGTPETSKTLTEGHADNLSDCDSSINNRFRIGAFLYQGTDIPIDGTSDDSLLSANNINTWECIDAFIPLGQYFVDNKPQIREQSMRQIYHGFWELDLFPALSSTSMAAPVALSSLNYHQSQTTDVMTPQALFDEFTKHNKIADPLQHQKFNVYKLGYRSTNR